MSKKPHNRSMGLNKHHILFYREYHEANNDNKWLRTKGLGLIALMDTDSHDALHRNVPGVPPLDPFTAQRVHRTFVGHPNPLIATENFMTAVEEALKSPKTYQLERELGQLTVMAVDLQRPFIREGLVLP